MQGSLRPEGTIFRLLRLRNGNEMCKTRKFQEDRGQMSQFCRQAVTLGLSPSEGMRCSQRPLPAPPPPPGAVSSSLLGRRGQRRDAGDPYNVFLVPGRQLGCCLSEGNGEPRQQAAAAAKLLIQVWGPAAWNWNATCEQSPTGPDLGQAVVYRFLPKARRSAATKSSYCPRRGLSPSM